MKLSKRVSAGLLQSKPLSDICGPAGGEVGGAARWRRGKGAV